MIFYHQALTTEYETTTVPYPRMGRHNSEAGESPALSRNCIPHSCGEPGRTP